MNQQCKVCGEPAAGFHFGAFTCEGCKSFFGRSYNNLSSISECKNNGECVINKKNRTSCKACRLRKCLLVGMSKSGSRYGRRSNWFKIHCLLQEQQQQQQQQQQQHNHHHQPQQHLHHHQVRQKSPPLGLLGHHQHALDQRLHHQLAAAALSHHRTKEDLMLMGLDEYKTAASPSVSSPESHNSDSSVEVGDQRLASPAKDLFVPLPFASLAGVGVFPHAFLPAAAPFLFPTHGGYLYPPKHHLLKAPQPLNNNNIVEPNSKRFYLDAILKSQQLSEDESSRLTAEDDGRSSSSPLAQPDAEQDNPMDLSMKGCRIRHDGGSPCTPPRSEPDEVDSDREDDDAEEDDEDDSLAHSRRMSALAEHRATPMDLTTRA